MHSTEELRLPRVSAPTAVAHKLPSASAHVHLRLLNIKGPDYALVKSDSLRISLNMGPAFSAETSGAGGKGAISCMRNGLLITPPGLELSHRASTRRPNVRGLEPAKLAIFIVSRELVAHSLTELGLCEREVAVTYRTIESGDVLLPLAQSLLADLMEGSPDGGRATESLAKLLVGRLLLRMRTPVETATSRDAIAQVCRHIESSLNEPLGLRRLAKVAGLSQYHFCRVFHQEIGQSPHQYVMSARIEAARRLLRGSAAGGALPKQSMLDIALACGFGSSSHFSTQFRKHTGRSPLEWRSASDRVLQPGP